MVLPRATEERPPQGLPWAPLLLLRLRLKYWALAPLSACHVSMALGPTPSTLWGWAWEWEWGCVWAACPCALLHTRRAESEEQGLSWHREGLSRPPEGEGDALGAPRVHPRAQREATEADAAMPGGCGSQV